MAVMAGADALPGVLVAAGLVGATALGLLAVALLFLVAGAVIAPGFALTYGLLGELAPAGTVTEAYAWLGTGIAVGLAAGAAAGGVLVDGPGPGAAWLFAAGAVALGAVLVQAAGDRLEPERALA
jgi:MFS family permease